VSVGFIKDLSRGVNKRYQVPTDQDVVFTNYNTLDGYHLYTIASATSADVLANDALPPASTLTFEIYSDN
jgi:hypothetical protein